MQKLKDEVDEPYILKFSKLSRQGRVLQNLLMRQVHCLDDNALHFMVSAAKLGFGLAEFALVNGLKCKGGTSVMRVVASLKIKYLDKGYFDLVENGEVNIYPWGIDVFNETVEACTNKFRKKQMYYGHYGFPLALQIWLYEYCPVLEGCFVEHAFGLTPGLSSQLTMRAPKVDIGQSSRGEGEPCNADMRNELEVFQLYVDSKFGEILQAIGI
ncbi:hypothetical protein RND71_039538 [Anisodus tanguticus]|uniref:Uncharacterized protein n=1 Tax=Anisodus tanguticus TaxID=243964 RepID=A0AAE1QZD8_9SOLA|nr:hypothetical protein RND71_039538 [Anisodus tanguticus]